MPILRLWFVLSGLALLGVLLYEFAPILLPMLAIAAGLGAMTWGITRIARRVEATRGRQTDAAASKDQP